MASNGAARHRRVQSPVRRLLIAHQVDAGNALPGADVVEPRHRRLLRQQVLDLQRGQCQQIAERVLILRAVQTPQHRPPLRLLRGRATHRARRAPRLVTDDGSLLGARLIRLLRRHLARAESCRTPPPIGGRRVAAPGRTVSRPRSGPPYGCRCRGTRSSNAPETPGESDAPRPAPPLPVQPMHAVQAKTQAKATSVQEQQFSTQSQPHRVLSAKASGTAPPANASIRARLRATRPAWRRRTGPTRSAGPWRSAGPGNGRPRSREGPRPRPLPAHTSPRGLRSEEMALGVGELAPSASRKITLTIARWPPCRGSSAAEAAHTDASTSRPATSPVCTSWLTHGQYRLPAARMRTAGPPVRPDRSAEAALGFTAVHGASAVVPSAADRGAVVKAGSFNRFGCRADGPGSAGTKLARWENWFTSLG